MKVVIYHISLIFVIIFPHFELHYYTWNYLEYQSEAKKIRYDILQSDMSLSEYRSMERIFKISLVLLRFIVVILKA
jgi:hypothetical protein